MNYLIVAGGYTDYEFAMDLIKKGGFEVIIAVDAGMDFLYHSKITPDVILGDFDSVDQEVFEYFENQPYIEVISLDPEKDDTDTEHAIHYAIDSGATKIIILGGTGNRIDHLLGNISLLGIGLQEGIEIEMIDANNRIRMINQPITILKEEQLGKYLSLIPYSEKVKNITLTGVKYPLENAVIGGFNARGVSNEIVGDEAVISFSEGILIVIESRD